MMTKYGLWHHDTSTKDIKEMKEMKEMKETTPGATKTRKVKFDPKIQKIIIHTMTDILNSILEVSYKNSSKNKIYDILSTKFFVKTRETFTNNSIINMFKSDDKKINAIINRVESPINKIIFTGKRSKPEYDDPHYRKYYPARYTPSKRKETFENITSINNITNCPDGKFHHWSIVGKNLVCSLCSTKINTKFDMDSTKKIYQSYKYFSLQEMARKYCNDGTLHIYIYNGNKKCYTCTKCKKDDIYKYSVKELDDLNVNMKKHKEELKQQTYKAFEQIQTVADKQKEYEQKVMEKIKTLFTNDTTRDDPYRYVTKYIENIKNIIGTESNLSSSGILLTENVYYVDHDHQGNSLDKPFTITNTENKITYKSNHPFFKLDVIYYTSQKFGKLDVYYSAKTNLLLGYKEANKDYVITGKTDKKIKLNYSLTNKIKLLGYESHFVNVYDKYIENEKDFVDMMGPGSEKYVQKDEIIRDIVQGIIRKRIDNLKKVIVKFQRFLWRFKYNVPLEKEKTETNPELHEQIKQEYQEIDPYTVLFNKYYKKLLDLKLEDEQKKHTVFKHWKAVIDNIFADSLVDHSFNYNNEKLYNAETISKYSKNSNLLLYYIVSEIDKLMSYNTNKFLKTNIAMFMIEFLSMLFFSFNNEELLNIPDIKKFMYIVKSETFLFDIEQSLKGTTEGIYEEYKDPDDITSDEYKERLEDAEEEQLAIDTEVGSDEMLEYITTIDDAEYPTSYGDTH
jgi:hypothetical protein